MSSCSKKCKNEEKDGKPCSSPPCHYNGNKEDVSSPPHSKSRRNHLGSDSTLTTTMTASSSTEVGHYDNNNNNPNNSSTNNNAVSVILDCHAVLGDRNSRGGTAHSTTATTILRQVKHEFKQRYAGRPLSAWYPLAVQEYQARIQRAFSNNTVAQQQPGLVLIKCTKEAMATDRVQTLYTHRLATQHKAAYGIAKLPTALEFYFKSRTAVTLASRVQYYQDALQKLKQTQAPSPLPPPLLNLYEEFQELLDFCQRKINQAAAPRQSVLSKQLLQKLNLMPALKEQWELLLQEQQKALDGSGENNMRQPRDHKNSDTIHKDSTKEDTQSPQQASSPQDGLADLAFWDHDQDYASTDDLGAFWMDGGELTTTDEAPPPPSPPLLPAATTHEDDHKSTMLWGTTIKETVITSLDNATPQAMSFNEGRPSHRRCVSLPTQGPKDGDDDLPIDFLHHLPWEEEDVESSARFVFEPEGEPWDLIEQPQQDATSETGPLKKSPVGHRRSCSVPPQFPQPQQVFKTMLNVPTKAMPGHRRRCASDGGGAENESLGSSGQKRPRRPRASRTNRRRTHSDSSKRSRHDDSTTTSSHNHVPLEIETRSSEDDDEEEELAMHKFDMDDYNDCVDSYGNCHDSQPPAIGLVASERPLRLAIGDGHSGLYTGTRCRQSGLPHGKGKMLYEKDQTVYKGEWCQGLWHGDGYYRDCNRGYMYQGEFFRHGKHGTGTEFFADGSVLQGMFCNGRIVSGEMKYPDGSSYNGHWNSNGAPHGQGTFVAVDGGVFEGTYLNGERTQGTFRYPDGMLYRGEWSRARPNGHGETKFPDGTEYQGEHKDGLFHGSGRLVWPNGAWYEGEFRSGKKTGFGKECDANGEVIHEGLFREGERAVGPIYANNAMVC